MEYDDDVLGFFLDEVEDVLDEWERICLDIKNGKDGDMQALFRCAHNLKGSSKSVGLDAFGDFVHKIEDLIGAIVHGSIELNEGIADSLLTGQSLMSKWVEELKNDYSYTCDQSSYLTELELLQGKLLESNSEAEVSDFGSIVVKEGMATQSEVEQASQIQQRKIGEVMVDEGIISDEEVKVVLDKQVQQEVKVQKQKKGNETLRVTAQKIDSLIQLIGELSVQMSIIKHGSKTCVLNPTTAKAVELSDKICREIQGESLSLRMQPLKKLFQRLERIIYDLATSMNKIVEVRFEGSEVELDKLIIENISDPLIHIVRNAVDHGLEDLEERLDSGKDAEAVIKIMAIQDPAGVIIKIQDDGRGINADKVFTKALERGIVKIDQKLTTKEITQLIFEPGFSTAEKVTDVSGRGVGMDIVRKAVERISGNLEVDSEFGKGTTFNIMLPTSLSIIDALLIEVDNEQYAVPLLEVSEIIDLSHHIQEENSRMINLRGSIVPVENLSEYFPITQYREEVTTSSESVPYSRPALVVDVNRNNIAFEVDKVIGQHQIVVKNFNDFLSPVIGFSGSCIMANGEAGMIIELKKIAEGHIKNQAISRGIYE